MKVGKEIKELAKEIHKAEHLFVGNKIDKKHKLEDWYYLLGAIVFYKLKEEHADTYNAVIDLTNEIKLLKESMKEVSKQQKYLWQTLDKKNNIFHEKEEELGE